jgi:hypothetical protein
MFFKIYIWPYLILGLTGIVEILAKEHSVFEIFRETVFWSFSPICIFLYAYEKKWLPVLFWKIYFFLSILDVIYDFFYVQKFSGVPFGIIYVISYVVFVFMVIPSFFAVYLYAFKRDAKK